MPEVTTELTHEGHVGWDGEADRHRVVCIEYVDRLPRSVTTFVDWDHTSKPWFDPETDRPRGTCPHYFDFDWCRHDKTLYFHESGMGGELDVSLGSFSEPDPAPGEIWTAPGLVLVRWASKRQPRKVIRSDAELLKMGYRRLRKPRLLARPYGGKTRNPFEAAEESRTVYCRWCEDHLPESDGYRLCDHLRWCDECSDWFNIENGQNADDEEWICTCKDEDDE